MSKKIGKFILAATAVTTAAAAAYYFMRKDRSITIDNLDEDFDDFSDESVDDSERSYVELNAEAGTSGDGETPAKEPVTFTSLTKQIKKTAGRVVGRTIEAVEDFFDDEEKDGAENSDKDSEASSEELSGEDADKPVSVKIEEDIVDAVKADTKAKKTSSKDADNSDPAVKTEKDTVEAVSSQDAEESEVFLEEEEESDGKK